MRCKACNKILGQSECLGSTPWGEPEELCRTCLNVIRESDHPEVEQRYIDEVVRERGEVQEDDPVLEMWEQIWSGDV